VSSKAKRLLGVSALAALLLVAMLVALNAPGFALASSTTDGSATAAQPNDLGPLTPPPPGTGKQPTSPPASDPGDEVIPFGPAERARSLPLDTQGIAPLDAKASQAQYAVGDTRRFLILDDTFGRARVADYEVKLISDTVEVWVQKDLRYRNLDQTINPIHPEADHPRYITQDRIVYLATEAARIFAKDVEYFGDYAERTGAEAILPAILGLPDDYYAGPAKRVIILVSNIRDDNYYDPVNNPSRIVGFVWSTFNLYSDRNMISIDSSRWDTWLGAPQYQYDATLAHEFQHLINGDQDLDGEDSWLNEGLSEYAEFLLGYRPSMDDHRTQWSDYPENSLTLWGDQDDDPDQPGLEILADYQQAYWFMLYLAGRLKQAGIGVANDQFLKDVSFLTKDALNGSASVDAMLASVGAPFRFRQLWLEFRMAMLQGDTSDQSAWGGYISQHQGISGVPIAPLDLGRMRHNLNFEGYDMPGVAPDSTDYIALGWSPAITPATMLGVDGDNSPVPTDWHVIPIAESGIPTATTASGNVLYSGHTDMTDNFLIFPVSVPASGDKTLAFDTLYNIEQGWDFGFVQVTTDTVGALGFQSLAVPGTVTETDPDALPIIKANVPGFSGVSGSEDEPAWVHVSYDLSAYADQNILLAFRYSSDPSTAGTIDPPPPPGWYLDNIKVGATSLFTDEAAVPATARSLWQARHIANSFDVRLLTFTNHNGPAVSRVFTSTLNAQADGSFNLGAALVEPGFNEAGERAVLMVSAVAPTTPDDVISVPSVGAPYRLTGLPPSVYTSRPRVYGSANDTSVRQPSVYPGNVYTYTVTVDDLGRAPDLSAAPVDAYVAVPIPAYSTFVPGSLDSTVASENMTFTLSLQTLDAALPAVPGVYWHGTVTRTADLAFQLRATQPLTIGTIMTGTSHIANGPFSAPPTQYFTRTANVKVTSPFALSSATGSRSVSLGGTAVYTYTLLNTDTQTRDVDMLLTIPANTTLKRLSITNQTIEEKTAQAGQDLTVRLQVPSYLMTEQLTVVTVELGVGAGYTGATVNPQARFYQPDSRIPWLDLPLDIPGGATEVIRAASFQLYLPYIIRSGSPPNPRP